MLAAVAVALMLVLAASSKGIRESLASHGSLAKTGLRRRLRLVQIASPKENYVSPFSSIADCRLHLREVGSNIIASNSSIRRRIIQLRPRVTQTSTPAIAHNGAKLAKPNCTATLLAPQIMDNAKAYCPTALLEAGVRGPMHPATNHSSTPKSMHRPLRRWVLC
jgi:hypothetical protein